MVPLDHATESPRSSARLRLIASVTSRAGRTVRVQPPACRDLDIGLRDSRIDHADQVVGTYRRVRGAVRRPGAKDVQLAEGVYVPRTAWSTLWPVVSGHLGSPGQINPGAWRRF